DRAGAERIYRKLLERDPLNYPAWANLGTCLAHLGRPKPAGQALIRALSLVGRTNPEVRQLVVTLLQKLGQELPLRPDPPLPEGKPTGALAQVEEPLATLGKLLSDTNHLPEAIRCDRLAITLNPAYALGHWNLALALLADQQWRQGWQEYEWRWHWTDCPEPRRRLSAPLWRGQALSGKRILVWTEQGLGDALQFVPLVRQLQHLDARVILEAATPIKRLLAQSFPDCAVVNRPDHPDQMGTTEKVDYQIPLLSLPQRLKLQPEDLPLAQAYLKADPKDVEAWQTQCENVPHPRIRASASSGAARRIRSLSRQCASCLTKPRIKTSTGFHCSSARRRPSWQLPTFLTSRTSRTG
ncbi:MAG TPA: tetratricopeptide repeat protein, partial [Nevskiaceae bacterium]|nr:tetratricopeptide repeat protein [Nevskiaceae bacterium]